MALTIQQNPSLQNAILPYGQRPAVASSSGPPGSPTDATTQKLQSAMREQFLAKANDPKAFHDLMAKSFGPGYDQGKAEALRQKALAGDFSWLPPVRLLDAKSLNGANGAYDAANGVVYINADIAARDPKLAASTYVEEAGAHLDSLLNTSDAVGDEGEMFRRLMAGEKLSQGQVDAIRAENDHGTITVDGKQVAVEFWNPLGAIKSAAKAVGGAIKKAAKAVGGAVKKAASGIGGAIKSAASHVWGGIKSFGRAIKDAGKTAMNGLQSAGETLMGGLGKMTVGFFLNLAKGKVGDALSSVFEGAKDIAIGMPKKLVRTAIDTARDAAKTVTHLLPEVLGSKARFLLDKGFGFVGGFTDGFLDATRRLVSAVTDPVAGLVGDLETSVRRLIDGDLRGAADAFGGAFKNLPGRFKDGFENFLFGPQPTPVAA